MVLYKEYIVEYKDFPIKGINYLDLNPIYADHNMRRLLVNDCCDIIRSEFKNVQYYKSINFDYIGVVESRGFLVGSILAHELQKGIVLLRSKKDRLPGKTHTVKHTLEYGESMIQVQEGSGKVLIFDDVLATGGTAKASIECLTKAGYTPIGALFLVELDFLNPLLSVPYKSIIHYE
jgi:adenine phosphoribosyltransferase